LRYAVKKLSTFSQMAQNTRNWHMRKKQSSFISATFDLINFLHGI
jgi:hypothetical protein